MKPYLFLEDLLEILPLCLSEDTEINILGKELLDTYDCCLFPLTIHLLYGKGKPLFPILSSKSEENFLGEVACNAFKQENYFVVGCPLWSHISWWFFPKEMLKQRLELFK